LLVSYRLLGQRFVSWRGGLLVVRELEHAERLANELDDCQLEGVVIVPCWPSYISDFLRYHALAGVNVFEDFEGVTTDVLVADVFAQLASDARAWLSETLRPARTPEVA
jgi:hypothetical protein